MDSFRVLGDLPAQATGLEESIHRVNTRQSAPISASGYFRPVAAVQSVEARRFLRQFGSVWTQDPNIIVEKKRILVVWQSEAFSVTAKCHYRRPLSRAFTRYYESVKVILHLSR